METISMTGQAMKAFASALMNKSPRINRVYGTCEEATNALAKAVEERL